MGRHTFMMISTITTVRYMSTRIEYNEGVERFETTNKGICSGGLSGGLIVVGLFLAESCGVRDDSSVY